MRWVAGDKVSLKGGEAVVEMPKIVGPAADLRALARDQFAELGRDLIAVSRGAKDCELTGSTEGQAQ